MTTILPRRIPGETHVHNDGKPLGSNKSFPVLLPLFPFTALPNDGSLGESPIEGLRFIPSLGSSELDDTDFIHSIVPPGGTKPLGDKTEGGKIRPDFSVKNKRVLRGVLEDKKKSGTLRAILEIGVNREGPESSTTCIIKTKLPETKYLGIDINGGVLDQTRAEDQNVFCLRSDSGEFTRIVAYANSLGIKEFDVIHIDGHHSVSQVLKDWKFSSLLSPDGVVVFHDTNYHPGPWCVFEAIDENLYDKTKFYTDEEYDWGCAVARKRKQHSVAIRRAMSRSSTVTRLKAAFNKVKKYILVQYHEEQQVRKRRLVVLMVLAGVLPADAAAVSSGMLLHNPTLLLPGLLYYALALAWL